MNYSLDKYKFYEYNDPKGKKTVSAVSTYAGRTVKGYAKCEYKMKEAQALLDQAQAHYNKMVNYFNDASRDKSFAENEVNCLLKEM